MKHLHRQDGPVRMSVPVRRLERYVTGILLVSLGIVLCKKCGWGISPISCVPLVLAMALPLSFGALTSIFHAVNVLVQMALTRGWRDARLWLQLPLALVFGAAIDVMNIMLTVPCEGGAVQLALLTGSICFTAVGMVLMLDADLVQNPPDGTVRQVSVMLNRPLGGVKVAYDVMCVVLAATFGLALLGRIEGLGIATLASALLVGKTIELIRGVIVWIHGKSSLVNVA